MSRRTIAAVVTVLLLSAAVGTEPASAGEWSADYRASLARTIAKRRENRARRSRIRHINDAISAYVFREVMMYPARLQAQSVWGSAGGSGGDGPSGGRSRRERDEDGK
jgi:hypothetical protein